MHNFLARVIHTGDVPVRRQGDDQPRQVLGISNPLPGGHRVAHTFGRLWECYRGLCVA